MTTKDQVREVLEMLPEDCTFDDVMYQLYIRERVARGLKAVEEGNVLTHEEAKARIMKRMEKWRALSGQIQPSTTPS
jgi:predicted transcriptional regulator